LGAGTVITGKIAQAKPKLQNAVIQYVIHKKQHDPKLNPKNSYEFFAPRADELQNSVKQHVMHKIQDNSKIKHDPNLRVKYFARTRVNLQ